VLAHRTGSTVHSDGGVRCQVGWATTSQRTPTPPPSAILINALPAFALLLQWMVESNDLLRHDFTRLI